MFMTYGKSVWITTLYTNIFLGRCIDLDEGKQDSEDDGCDKMELNFWEFSAQSFRRMKMSTWDDSRYSTYRLLTVIQYSMVLNILEFLSGACAP